VLPAGDLVGALGQARVARQGTDLSLIGYGAATWTCLEAAEELGQAGVSAEVVDLRTLIPYDEETVAASVKKTGRCVIVHEPQITMGFGAEIAARLSDAAFPWLDAPIRRVAYPDRPVPYAKTLERALLPGKEQVVAAARETLAF
jgi:pyruvate/2-oxoglutarate/acetoin dehydrogenase E1 component